MTSVSADTDRLPPGARDRGFGRTGGREAPSRLHGRPRRSVPHLALGALLVVASVTGFVVLSTQLDDRASVLALARPVTVGQVLAPADLVEVSIAADPQVATVSSSQAGSLVGSPMAVSLPAGSLLSPAVLGEAVEPGPGEAIVAVAVAPGQFPPELSAGSRVLVVPAPDSPAGDDSASGWAATVAGVHPTATDATTVVSMLLGEDDAAVLATAGQVSVVMISLGGG